MTTTEGETPRVQLQPTYCAICGTEDNSEELYPANLDADAFTATVFSARRLPDQVHYRIVRCRTCGLLRSDPVVDVATMNELYRASTFDYGEELDGLRTTYGVALDAIGALARSRHGLLDIGCGSGFVLELAQRRGWKDPRGAEPSADAVAKADPAIRAQIVQDVMRPGLFEPESFDAITLFQVLDHMPDPGALLTECLNVLRPGGVILAFNHNAAAWSARLLKERSPIIDVEHTYLYTPDTMRRLFSGVGFEVDSVDGVRNTYSTAYLMHLIPMPRALKQSLIPRWRRTSLGQRQLTVPLGNLCLLARRPG